MLFRSPGPMAFAGGQKVALADYKAADPTGVPASLAKASLIERGAYLARAADCLVCHTAPGGKQYSGGLGFKLPFGTLYSTNITPDKDTGIAVNPDTIVAQFEGGLIFGLTAALYGEITIEKGRVQQSNFNDYRMLRIDQAPKIDIHLIKSGEVPGGIGETGVTASSPALRNAIYAATGVALRRLPIDRSLIAVGKKS